MKFVSNKGTIIEGTPVTPSNMRELAAKYGGTTQTQLLETDEGPIERGFITIPRKGKAWVGDVVVGEDIKSPGFYIAPGKSFRKRYKPAKDV
jgi:hypothetical protein